MACESKKTEDPFVLFFLLDLHIYLGFEIVQLLIANLNSLYLT